MFRSSIVLGLLLLVAATASAVTNVSHADLIPAGTIIYCTMDEPNFSSKTVQIGDPVLCNLGPLRLFGHSAFPHGAQLSGHLEDYKNPGHLVGKGFLKIEFDRFILPEGQTLPLAAKLISAPHQRVDRTGAVRGKGHPKRDALLWSVPVFWPIKIITLPARGPFPTLKGESRLALRVMEDVELPTAVAFNSVPMPPWVKPSAFGQEPERASTATSRPVSPLTLTTTTERGARTLTVIALQGGAAVLAREYWVEGTELHCLLKDGGERDVPLASLDLAQTLTLNDARNVVFSLHARAETEE